MITTRKAVPAALAALALGAAAVSPAAGQATKPAPGCWPPYPDKKGDAEPANMDITGFWFDTIGTRVTANLRIADLTKDLPPESTGANWYVLWTADDTPYFVTAQIEIGQSEPTYGWGVVEETPNGTLRDGQGDTAGAFFEGEEGVIQIDIPADAGGVNGKPFTAVSADTQSSLGIPGVVSSLAEIDTAAGKPYTVGSCPEGEAPPPPPATTPPPATGGGTSTGREVAKGKLDVGVSKRLPRARAVKRSLAVRLTSKKGVTGLDAALFKGAVSRNKVVAKGRKAKLGRRGTVKLRVSKKLKKGAYTLYLVGNNADGTAADKTVKLRLK